MFQLASQTNSINKRLFPIKHSSNQENFPLEIKAKKHAGKKRQKGRRKERRKEGRRQERRSKGRGGILKASEATTHNSHQHTSYTHQDAQQTYHHHVCIREKFSYADHYSCEWGAVPPSQPPLVHRHLRQRKSCHDHVCSRGKLCGSCCLQTGRAGHAYRKTYHHYVRITVAACWRLAGNRNKHHVIGTSAISTNSELACCDLQCLLVLQNFKCCNLDELQA